MDESNKTLNDIESFEELSEQTAEELASAFESFSKSMEDNAEIYERILGNLKQEVRWTLSEKFVELVIHFANATFLTRWYWRRKIKKFIQGLDEITKNNCDLDCWQDEGGRYKASVFVGEDYYVSADYKTQDLALCEVKGWLEGTKVKIESTLKAIDEKLKEYDKKNK